jgi:hypothetical protein
MKNYYTPWTNLTSYDGTSVISDSNNNLVHFDNDITKYVVNCVNACEGMNDPIAEVYKLKCDLVAALEDHKNYIAKELYLQRKQARKDSNGGEPSEKMRFDFTKTPSSDWHSRGELPPVDVQCMQGNQIVKIVAHLFNGENKYAAFQHIDGKGCGYSHADSFRPLKSERERAIEEMCKVIDSNSETAKYNLNIDCSAALRFAIEALYDAGYRKEGK